MNCPRCRVGRHVKAGFSSQGRQRYHCKLCGYHYTTSQKRSYSEEIKEKAIRMVADGAGLRQTGRHFGISQVTIMRWVRQYGETLREQQRASARTAEKVGVVEIDELCTWIGSKKNIIWLWQCVDKATRKILAFRLANRSSGALKTLLWQYKLEAEKYCTDHYAVYSDVLPQYALVQGKAHTYTVESKNALLRLYTKMLNRKTRCGAKTYKTLNAVIAIVIQRINHGYHFHIDLTPISSKTICM